MPLASEVSRIVSLVPSLTEALALSCPEKLVAATDWCTHPADLVVARVRGTKNPGSLETFGRERERVTLQVGQQRRDGLGCRRRPKVGVRDLRHPADAKVSSSPERPAPRPRWRGRALRRCTGSRCHDQERRVIDKVGKVI